MFAVYLTDFITPEVSSAFTLSDTFSRPVGSCSMVDSSLRESP